MPDEARAGELIGLEECTYEHNGVEYTADCGTLTVPENRSDPTTRLIALPVIRVIALEDHPAEPIFWFAGGPGNSNMSLPGLSGLIENHDMVMVGYRGRDGSVVLECPEMAQAIKGVGDNLLSAESTAHFGQGITDCAERLQAKGVDLDGYSIPEVVEDMEAARKAFSYDHVNLLSASYGTRVALIYAWMYPESLHRSVMVNVNPPGHFAWEPDVVDAQIRYDADLCKQDPECSSRTDDLAETIRNVSHNMPERWLLIPIDSGKVRFLTHFMLFNRGTSATVFDAYLAAEEGDPSGLALMSMAFDFMIPSVTTWGHWAAMGSLDYDPARNWIIEMDPPNSILGSPTSLMVGAATQQSGGWPVAPMPDAFREVQPTAVETLLVSGSIDYSTPSQAATEELQPALRNGEHIILSEFGHFNDVWGFQSEATRHMLATFFDSGEVDDSLFTYQQMDFHVGLGFPVIAKIGLAVALFAIGGLLALLRFILRRRKNQAA
ncbi:alpha/beta fold hydrolase [Candidatus Leptofilum sp.]|uniref:alpha/beta fold hydrolase n=1 Tax=Candidatus Leptofilum sp. TaxID=3241576 RepID=UPI003B5C5C54